MSTSDCERCREFLLTAEPEQLRDASGSPWRDHLQTCPACAADVRAVLAQRQALVQALAALSTPPAEIGATGAAPRALPARRRFRQARAWAPAFAALAAAAVILLLVLPHPDTTETAPPPFRPLSPAAEPGRPPVVGAVNGGGGSGVAIMPTNDPDIIVVWTF